MRITLMLLLLGAMFAAGATRSPAAGLPAPTIALQTPTMPTASTPLGSTEVDLVKYGFAQGGLTLVLILTLVSYRRDFFRKNEAKDAELAQLRLDKRELVAVMDKNADAMIAQAVAVQANTEATRLLAQNVNNLAERRRESRG